MTIPFIYNLRNLRVRTLSTALTFFVVAVVVFVLSVLLSFAAGIRESLAATGSDRVIVVLARGATAESTSIILHEEADRLVQTAGAARDASGSPVISREICVQTSIPRRGTEAAMANVAVRGVDDVAFDVHRTVRIVEGRRPLSGTLEVVVGIAAQQSFANLTVGADIQLGRLENRRFVIVGVFDARGGAQESEIWAPRTIIADAYKRSQFSSVFIPLADGASASQAIEYIEGPAVGLEAKTEAEYYKELSKKTSEIVGLATFLVGIMAIGAIFAVANTMYAAVDGRRREIAMLRILGFGRAAIMLSFAIESLLICIPACLAGLAGSMLLSGTRQDYLSDETWTVLAYELRVTPEIFIGALALAMFVGVAGALAPAVRAARTRVIDALRRA